MVHKLITINQGYDREWIPGQLINDQIVDFVYNKFINNVNIKSSQ